MTLYISIFGFGSTIKKDYAVSVRPDGGYILNITVNKRYWTLITPEGVFPKEKLKFVINVMGKGRDWSFRGQEGFYYSLDEITTNMHHWDFGYAWIDSSRKNLYLNLFWVHAPDRMMASDVNGKYALPVQ